MSVQLHNFSYFHVRPFGKLNDVNIQNHDAVINVLVSARRYSGGRRALVPRRLG